jgi:hypothetical protein
LKVEIGGDVESSYGTMSSFMHVADPAKASYERGVNFWMMKEALKRDPTMPLICLSWGMPYWVGWSHGNGNTLSEGGVKYHVDYILGAKLHHNLTFSMVGVWNEAYGACVLTGFCTRGVPLGFTPSLLRLKLLHKRYHACDPMLACPVGWALVLPLVTL